MTLSASLLDGLWAAVFAVAFGVLLSMPLRGLGTCALCGLVGSVVRDMVVGLGASASWATVVATIAVVLATTLELRGRRLAPVAIICGILPLGAAVSYFQTIAALLRIPSQSGLLLEQTSLALVANVGRAFTITLAIAVGIGTGLFLISSLERIAKRRRS
jgi:uncharacterized membrane protein YjjB (DUF3815 family)